MWGSVPIHTSTATVLIPSITTLGTALVMSSQGNMVGLPKLHPAAVNSNATPPPSTCRFLSRVSVPPPPSLLFLAAQLRLSIPPLLPSTVWQLLSVSPCVQNQQPGTKAFPELTCKQVTQSICYHLQSCLVLNFFLILLARRDVPHFQPDSPSSPLPPNHFVNHIPSW